LASLAFLAVNVFVGCCSVREVDDRVGFAPQILEAVKGSLVRREDVDDEVAEVEEHPTAGRGALFMAQRVAFGFELAFEVVGEGVELEG